MRDESSTRTTSKSRWGAAASSACMLGRPSKLEPEIPASW